MILYFYCRSLILSADRAWGETAVFFVTEGTDSEPRTVRENGLFLLFPSGVSPSTGGRRFWLPSSVLVHEKALEAKP